MTSLEWSGDINRSALWIYISLHLAFAAYVNISFIVAIIRLREKRTSTDILIAGLCSGILVVESDCLPQCFMSLIASRFMFGMRACWVEAFIHIVGFQIQFFCVSAIAYRTYVGVVKNEQFTQQRAMKILGTIWVASAAGTALFGAFSDYGLTSSGTFCFYSWVSVALLGWAWPTCGLCAILMGYWYYQTFKTVKAVRRAAKCLMIDGSQKDADIAIRLAFLVFLFLFGYIVQILLSIYESVNGKSKKPAFDITAVVCVLIYMSGVPFAYGYTNRRLGIRSALYFTPYGSTAAHRTRSNHSKGSNLPSADARVEMSAVTQKDIVQVTKAVDNGNNEGDEYVDEKSPKSQKDEYVDERSPKSQRDYNEDIGSSRIGLIGDSGRNTPDIHQTSPLSIEPIQETPLIFNPFTSRGDFDSKEVSRIDNSSPHQATPPDPPSASLAGNFHFFTTQQQGHAT